MNLLYQNNNFKTLIEPSLLSSLQQQQRFHTEDHLMIHRHKHEMTLKFPSIKSDNMLSGEFCGRVAADGRKLSRFWRRGASGPFCRCFCRRDSLATYTPVCHQENFMARLRHLFTM